MNLPEKIEDEKRVAVDFVGKIQAIDNAYKKSFSRYQEKLATFTLKIEQLKNRISLKKKSLEEEEQVVTLLENNLLHEEKNFEKLNGKCTQQIEALYALQTEYKNIINEAEYEKILFQKEGTLQVLLSEIEEQELSLLNIELERINRVNLLTPKQNSLKKLEEELKVLELEKIHCESSQLENQLLLDEPLAKPETIEKMETIETEVVEKED